MRPFLLSGGAILGFAAIFYAAALALSFAVFPPQTGPLDTEGVFHADAAYRTESRYLVFNQTRLAANKERVIVLGSSNARVAFRPTLLQAALSGIEADNVALGGANMSELRQTTEVVYGEIQPDWRGHTVFVLGLSYLNFEDNATLWGAGDSDLVNEMLRFGFYEQTVSGELRPRLSNMTASMASFLLRPVIMGSYLVRAAAKMVIPSDLELKLRLVFHYGANFTSTKMLEYWAFMEKQTDTQLDALELDQDTRDLLLKLRLRDAGGTDTMLPHEQFAELKTLADEITARGDRLVIVDLPLPRWHVDGMPVGYRSYREQLAVLLPTLTSNTRIGYLDLTSLDDPDDFYDSAHPKPHIWEIWCKTLANYLRNGAKFSKVTPAIQQSR